MKTIVEAPMSGEKFRSVIDNSEIRLGFELEFYCKHIPTIPQNIIQLADLGFDTDGSTFSDNLKFERNYPTFFNIFKPKRSLMPDFKKFVKEQTVVNFDDKEQLLNIKNEIMNSYMDRNPGWEDLFSKEELSNRIDERIMKYKTKVRKFWKEIVYNTITYSDESAFSYLLYDHIKAGNLSQILEKYEFDLAHDLEWSDESRTAIDMSELYSYYDNLRSFFTNNIPEINFDTTWELTDDGSLGDDGYELISPPLQIRETLTVMKKLFSLMKKYNMTTDSSTGFHMGISFTNKSKMRKLDLLKFVMFLGDEYVLKQFGRFFAGTDFTINPKLSSKDDNIMDAEGYNNYAQSIYHALGSSFPEWADISYFITPKSINRGLNKLRIRITKEKYYSVNFQKLDYGYIEIRSAGGDDYHIDFDKIAKTALRYANVLTISADPEMYKNEYIKKLVLFVTKAIEGYDFNTAKETDYRIMEYAKKAFGKSVALINRELNIFTKDKTNKNLELIADKIIDIANETEYFEYDGHSFKIYPGLFFDPIMKLYNLSLNKEYLEYLHNEFKYYYGPPVKKRKGTR